MSVNIILCGVGGQGTVLASKLIASCAMKKNIAVMSAETIGMAQRGGSVFSHLRLGEDVCTPMIAKGEGDIMIAFEPAEAVRMLPYLKKEGTVIVNNLSVMPVTASLGANTYNANEMIDYLKEKVKNLIVVDGKKACESIGSMKVLNTVLLGAGLHTGKLPMSIEDMQEVMAEKVKPQFLNMNIKALNYIKMNGEGRK